MIDITKNDLNKRPPGSVKRILKIVFFILIIPLALLILSAFFNSSSLGTANTTNVAAVTPQTPESIVCNMDPQDLGQKAQTISYAQLEKDPNSYQGTFAKFTGQILQIQQSGNDGIIRLSVTNEGYGIWSQNDVVYVEYHRSTTAVNGDIVTVYGMLNGTQTYTSEANYQITLPDLVACSIGQISNTNSGGSQASQPKPNPVSNGGTSNNEPGAGQGTESTNASVQSNVTPAPVSSGTWHTAFTYIGSTPISTQSFSLQGSKWRITYNCGLTDSSINSAYFGGSVDSIDNNVTEQFANTTNCPGSSTSYVYSQPPGQYYLDINEDNAGYSVTVEDYY